MSTPAQRVHVTHSHVMHESLHLPEPTPWPIVLAAGLVLVMAALVMHFAIGLLGGVLVIAGAVGWFRDVLPHERVEHIEVAVEEIEIRPSEQRVTRIEVGETHRAQLPLRVYPISAGLKGGIAGGIAMVIPAELYSLVRYHSLWYVVNLLGGAGVGEWVNPTEAQIAHFNLRAFITANVIQGATTLLVGLLYGALLPVWPTRPMILGGIVAPVLWTGMLHSVLGIVNPYLQQHIDWWSFAASQIIFGLVAGYVVARLGGLQQLAQAPLAVRLGVESPGLSGDPSRKEHGQ
jgi:hypothetical protein